MGKPGTAPVIRVRHMQENLAALDRLEEARVEAVLDSLGDTVALIRGSASSSWMPVEVDVEVTEAVGAICGEDAVHRWSRRALELSLGGPLLRGIVQGALRMVGRDPRRIVKFVPRGIAGVYRNCGSWSSAETGDGFVDLHWSRVPKVVFDSPMSRHGFAGAFVAVLDVADVEGTVEVSEGDGALTFSVRWPTR